MRLLPREIRNAVREFYERVPFPNYEDCEDISSLIQKAEASVFYSMLNEQIPFGIKVLEVGCGTGQLANYLGIAHRYVFGTDICFNSLKLADDFKIKNGMKRVNFSQMDLFKPIFRDESFPLVICIGVLHHTSDPFAGFLAISKLVEKGGYIIIGLYNRYGRIPTDIRRYIFNITGARFRFLDPRLREKISELKKEAWFLDQYKNPHESKHTMGEVLKWFDKAGFEYMNSIPPLRSFKRFSRKEKIFRPNKRGGFFDCFIAQLSLLFAGGREGGLFLMIGRRVK